MASGGRERQQGSGRNTLIGLVVLLLVGAVLVLIVRAVFILLTSASPAVLGAVIVTSGTILVSVASLILSNRHQQRQQVQQELRIRRAEVYEELLTYWFWVMRERRDTSEGKRKQRDEQYRATVPQKLITWGSEDVIRVFTAQVGPGGATEETSMLGFEKLLFAIRKDLGHEDTSLREGDLLRPFLKGVDEALCNKQQGA
jgi:hypothetical protein